MLAADIILNNYANNTIRSKIAKFNGKYDSNGVMYPWDKLSVNEYFFISNEYLSKVKSGVISVYSSCNNYTKSNKKKKFFLNKRKNGIRCIRVK